MDQSVNQAVKYSSSLCPLCPQSPVVENPPSQMESNEEVFDDSGVSVSSSGNNSSAGDPGHQHETASTSSENSISTSEKWAQVSTLVGLYMLILLCV